jgi:hypothetical protein
VNTDSGKSLKSVHLQPESLFTLNQNGCSRSSGMGVHDGPEYAPNQTKRPSTGSVRQTWHSGCIKNLLELFLKNSVT